MIKKTRNAFLAAAVASVCYGCTGAGGPLGDPNVITNAGTSDALTNRAIAELFGSAFSQLIGATSSVFGTLNTMTSANTVIGAALAPTATSNKTAQASGIVIAPAAPTACGLAGTFELNALLSIARDPGTPTPADSLFNDTPNVAEGLGDFVNGDAAISVNAEYTACSEPVTTYDLQTGAAMDEMDADGNLVNTIIDGIFAISLRSQPDATNQNFSLNASIEMKDYFIQRFSEGTTPSRPDVLNGDISLSLKTSGTDNYSMTMSTDIVNNKNNDGNGFVSSALTLEGDIAITSTFGIGAYNLQMDGRLRSYAITGGDASFQVYTVENLARTAGAPATGEATLGGILGFPSQGVLALTTVSANGTTETSTATVTATGIDIVTVVNGQQSPYSCTWAQVNDGSCGS